MKSFLWEVMQEQMLLAEEKGVAPAFWHNATWLNGKALAPLCEIIADQLGEIIAARQRQFAVTGRSRKVFLTVAALCAFANVNKFLLVKFLLPLWESVI